MTLSLLCCWCFLYLFFKNVNWTSEECVQENPSCVCDEIRFPVTFWCFGLHSRLKSTLLVLLSVFDISHVRFHGAHRMHSSAASTRRREVVVIVKIRCENEVSFTLREIPASELICSVFCSFWGGREKDPLVSSLTW